jgi:L-asparaginase/Glu-tRNA(Gln) amidotransferase subunit D
MTSALLVAADPRLPEVMVAFGSRLLRGNRTRKVSTWADDAFDSPTLPALGELGPNLRLHYDMVLPPPPQGWPLVVHTVLCTDVAIFHVSPGLKITIAPTTRGLIVATRGCGALPADLIPTLAEASRRGIIVVIVTTVTEGDVSFDYASGPPLQEAAVLGGADLTLEAATTKMMYVLSRDDWTLPEKRAAMGAPLKGEMKH